MRNFSLQSKPLYHPSTLLCVQAQPNNNKYSIKTNKQTKANAEKQSKIWPLCYSYLSYTHPFVLACN